MYILLILENQASLSNLVFILCTDSSAWSIMVAVYVSVVYGPQFTFALATAGIILLSEFCSRRLGINALEKLRAIISPLFHCSEF